MINHLVVNVQHGTAGFAAIGVSRVEQLVQ